MSRIIAALFVDGDGVYNRLRHVDIWDEVRDARKYKGPYPVVAHPPCERWGKYWYGSPIAAYRMQLGDDDGCFKAALAAVRKWGGVLEHPKDSHAWNHFGLQWPRATGGWTKADRYGGWTCCVEQGFYGHSSCKPTWLYACADKLPELRWGRGNQRLDPIAVQRYGYEKARKIGIISMVSGKDRQKLRAATPPLFRNVLVAIARSRY